jgi:hypothetical protein
VEMKIFDPALVARPAENGIEITRRDLEAHLRRCLAGCRSRPATATLRFRR